MFSKFGDCIVGPGMPVAKDEETEQLDYEVELGVVIGASVPRYTQPGKYSKPVWGFLKSLLVSPQISFHISTTQKAMFKNTLEDSRLYMMFLPGM